MSLFRAALILGLLSAVGPFAIDMYLPALPTIAADLQADVATVQWTLTAYFMAFGVAQLLYGPWADQAGRRRPLFFGLGVFIAGSVWSAVAGDINHLIAARCTSSARWQPCCARLHAFHGSLILRQRIGSPNGLLGRAKCRSRSTLRTLCSSILLSIACTGCVQPASTLRSL